MSQIHVDPDEYGDIVLALLLDAIRDEDVLKNSERFREFVEFLDKRGAKNPLLHDFIKMDSNTRVKYKRINDVFKGGSAARINIGKDLHLKEDFDRELCKRIFRKVKEVRFKTSKPITEERLNKIIDYCINEREEQK